MPPVRAHKTPRARIDLQDCAIYLADHASVHVALRFLECAEVTFGLLAEHPGFGRPLEFTRPELEGLRSFRVQGFENHLIFYLPRESGIEVVRVLHGARDLEAIFDGPDGEGE
ncbi:MAG: type II toxin-antitoxin system RelE/ParE family toxin [Planctomycetota bacterium]